MKKGTLIMCRNTHQSFKYEARFDDSQAVVSDSSGAIHLLNYNAIAPDWDRIFIYKLKQLINKLSKWIF